MYNGSSKLSIGLIFFISSTGSHGFHYVLPNSFPPRRSSDLAVLSCRNSATGKFRFSSLPRFVRRKKKKRDEGQRLFAAGSVCVPLSFSFCWNSSSSRQRVTLVFSFFFTEGHIHPYGERFLPKTSPRVPEGLRREGEAAAAAPLEGVEG